MGGSSDNRVLGFFDGRAAVCPDGSFVEFKAEEVEQSVSSRFEAQATKYPRHLAVKRRNDEISYDCLNRSANRMARALMALSDKREEPIAIIAENDASAMTGILAILKAGKTYVPMDASFSRAWATFILEDTQARIILATRKTFPLAEQWSASKCHVIDIESADTGYSDKNLDLDIPPTGLAHILYTSGSTGQPKGVVDNHRNILHHVMRVTNSTYISTQDRMTLLRPPNSSGALMNAFSALLNGTSLFPMDVRDIGLAGMADWLRAERITFFHSGGTVFRHFAQLLSGKEQFPNLRLIRLSSGRISKAHVDLFKKYFSNCVLLHVLSSTEANTYRMLFLNKDSEVQDGTLPVGYAVKDMEVFIIDDDGNQVPTHTLGEIAIRSSYLFPYYWRNPALTKASFIPDAEGKDRRIFRTSDLGRLRADGCLEYHGRKDFRLKIRGHSIQAEEVEIALLKIPQVKHAVVAAKQDEHGDDRLIAYVVFGLNSDLSVSQLRDMLKETLPDYMVPSNFVILDSLPLMPNGKVNRQGLPPPTGKRPRLSSPFVEPQSPVQAVIAKRWAEVLWVERIGVHDSFFDLGGDSLLASKIVSNLSRIFPWNLSLPEFFEALTVARMADALLTKEPSAGQTERIARTVLQIEAMSGAEIRAAVRDERSKRSHE